MTLELRWVFLAGLTLWSAWLPANAVVWCFEAAPAIGVMGLLFVAQRRWRPTPLAQAMLTLGIALMLVGAHFTYAGMPLFTLIGDSLGLARNHYDRFGHFFQGAIPAIVMREVLIRSAVMRRGPCMAGLITAGCLGIAACWEIVEWLAVAVAGGSPDLYLNFQGDPWDSQADMTWALIGAATALLGLGRLHDRQLRRLGADAREADGGTT